MVYLVEDDSSIRELVVYTLNSTGIQAEGFEKPSDFWKALNTKAVVGYSGCDASGRKRYRDTSKTEKKSHDGKGSGNYGNSQNQ